MIAEVHSEIVVTRPFPVFTALSLATLLTASIAGCSREEPAPTDEVAQNEPASPEPEPEPEPEPAPVEVSVDGSTFDPPVEASRIPSGAWICDMGTVHYAQTETGDGSCPVCGMRLTQRGD